MYLKCSLNSFGLCVLFLPDLNLFGPVTSVQPSVQICGWSLLFFNPDSSLIPFPLSYWLSHQTQTVILVSVYLQEFSLIKNQLCEGVLSLSHWQMYFLFFYLPNVFKYIIFKGKVTSWGANSNARQQWNHLIFPYFSANVNCEMLWQEELQSSMEQR